MIEFPLFNEFNDKMNIKTKINSEEELYNYLKNSSIFFKKVAASYKKRMLRILDRVINEKKIYLTDTVKIINYTDYLKENKDVDYLNFL